MNDTIFISEHVSPAWAQNVSYYRSLRSIDEPFYYQLMHIMLKNTELLKHSKINKNAPTCFGLHRNHLQGAKVSEDGFYVNRNMLERFYLS